VAGPHRGPWRPATALAGRHGLGGARGVPHPPNGFTAWIVCPHPRFPGRARYGSVLAELDPAFRPVSSISRGGRGRRRFRLPSRWPLNPDITYIDPPVALIGPTQPTSPASFLFFPRSAGPSRFSRRSGRPFKWAPRGAQRYRFLVRFFLRRIVGPSRRKVNLSRTNARNAAPGGEGTAAWGQDFGREPGGVAGASAQGYDGPGKRLVGRTVIRKPAWNRGSLRSPRGPRHGAGNNSGVPATRRTAGPEAAGGEAPAARG